MAELLSRFPRPGPIEAILLRSARHVDPQEVEAADLGAGGLVRDHARPGKRALTLFQAEHFPVITAIVGREATAYLSRRNLVVSGLNLNALRGAFLQLGPTAAIEITGPCAPCSRMEQALGKGGYNAVRGNGGWCATVLQPGRLSVGDEVTVAGLPDRLPR
jgi:MOSC domain-containing protein YiiM